MEIKGEHLTFLFGAGASYDAGIPISSDMVKNIEVLIDSDEEWKQFRDLYYYLKSSIQYSDGIFGKFNEQFNVERLLVIISEIEKRDKNIMYPFIGAWNIRLIDYAGINFENFTKLHKLIRRKLNEWVRIRNYEKANYYKSFDTLSSETGSLIKVFTLNYDLCFERIVGQNKQIELGFDRGTKEWQYSNFENSEGKSFFLYKLHGSIDWYIQNDNKLYISDDPVEKPELIFGIQHKMTSVDPYFFYSAELRKACFTESRLLIVIGYSFADDYVNIILSQALKAKGDLRLLYVGPTDDSDKEATNIKSKLNLNSTEQIIIVNNTAKDFMTNTMNKDYLASLMAEPSGAPF